MEALLILGGLLLVLAGLVWLVVLAFGTSLLWGLGSLIPPLTLVFVVRHWRVARKALALSALGIIPLVVGLALLASQDAQRFEAILEMRWLELPAEQPVAQNIQLRGELRGEPFKPQQAELLDGVLSLREGQDFFARREIRIRLPRPVSGSLMVDVLPEDQGELPEVEISWLLPGQDLPEARRLSRGYTLHLNLTPQAPNRLVGDFHLVLPPRYDTSLNGSIDVVRSGLRQHNGRIDYRFDSRDTLLEVVNQHLAARFPGRDLVLEALPAIRFPARQLSLDLRLQVDGKPRRLTLALIKDAERGWRVASAAEPKAMLESPQPVPVSAQAVPQPGPFSLVLLLSEPERYIGRSLSVSLVRGGTAEGVFTGLVEDGLIRLQRKMRAADGAVFIFHPDDIAFIRLSEP